MRKWLTKCDEFVMGDGGAWVEHRYSMNTDDITGKVTNPPNPPSLKPSDFFVVRREFVPHEEPAACVEVELTSQSKTLKTVQLNFLVRFDILPCFFSGWPDPAQLEAEVMDGMVLAHAVSPDHLPFTIGRWTAAMSCDTRPDRIAIGQDLWGPERTSGNGISALLKFKLDVTPSAKVRFVLSGDCEGESGAIETAKRVLTDFDRHFSEKNAWYNQIAFDMTEIETPDELFNEAFLWSKLNLEWSTITTPYQKKQIGDEWLTYSSPYIGTGVVAGYPDYPFYFGGDTEVSIMGILIGGLHETAKESLRLLGAIGMRQNGRIPHCVVTNGEVYDPGNIGETTLFIKSVWDTYCWTGDQKFLEQMYPVCKTCIFDYVLKQPKKDGVLLHETGDNPDSPRAKGFPSSAIVGFDAMAKLAERMGEPDVAEICQSEVDTMMRQVEELFWVEKEGFYAGQLDQNNKPVTDAEKKFWSCMHTSIVAAYDRVVDKDRIARALSRAEGDPYTCKWGIYLAENAGIMPYTAGRAGVGEFNYGRIDEGMMFIKTIARTMGHIMPGGFPETVDNTGDPERFMVTWPFVQLWSAAHVTHGLVHGLLRVEPDAANNTVTMTPKLPTGWPGAVVRNLLIGKSKIDVELTTKGTTVAQTEGPKLAINIVEEK